MAKRQFWIVNSKVRDNAVAAVNEAEPRSRVVIFDPQRSIPQNDRLHAMCDDVARQVPWRDMFDRPIWMNADKWKRFFAAAWLRSCGGASTVVPNEDGTGFYDLSMSTTEFNTSEASDCMEMIAAFGAQRNVVWSMPGEPKVDKRPHSPTRAKADA